MSTRKLLTPSWDRAFLNGMQRAPFCSCSWSRVAGLLPLLNVLKAGRRRKRKLLQSPTGSSSSVEQLVSCAAAVLSIGCVCSLCRKGREPRLRCSALLQGVSFTRCDAQESIPGSAVLVTA